MTTLLVLLLIKLRIRDIAFCLETDYGLDDAGVGARVSLGTRIFHCPQHPVRPNSPPSPLYKSNVNYFEG